MYAQNKILRKSPTAGGLVYRQICSVFLLGILVATRTRVIQDGLKVVRQKARNDEDFLLDNTFRTQIYEYVVPEICDTRYGHMTATILGFLPFFQSTSYCQRMAPHLINLVDLVNEPSSCSQAIGIAVWHPVIVCLLWLHHIIGLNWSAMVRSHHLKMDCE